MRSPARTSRREALRTSIDADRETDEVELAGSMSSGAPTSRRRGARSRLAASSRDAATISSISSGTSLPIEM
jgi:hypothetical protein